uniref:TPR_REGION domain-containing protein n=1 Tax=Globodera pallida TaxID=36090 RepID=A0A183CHI3_GLOPA
EAEQFGQSASCHREIASLYAKIGNQFMERRHLLKAAKLYYSAQMLIQRTNSACVSEFEKLMEECYLEVIHGLLRPETSSNFFTIIGLTHFELATRMQSLKEHFKTFIYLKKANRFVQGNLPIQLQILEKLCDLVQTIGNTYCGEVLSEVDSVWVSLPKGQGMRERMLSLEARVILLHLKRRKTESCSTLPPNVPVKRHFLSTYEGNWRDSGRSSVTTKREFQSFSQFISAVEHDNYLEASQIFGIELSHLSDSKGVEIYTELIDLLNFTRTENSEIDAILASSELSKKSTFYEAKQLSGHKRTRDSIIRSAAAPRVLRSGKVFDNRRCSALKQLSNFAIKEEEETEEEKIETDKWTTAEEEEPKDDEGTTPNEIGSGEEFDPKEVEEEVDRKELEEVDRKEVEEEVDRKEVEEEVDPKEVEEENDRKEVEEEIDRKEVEEEVDRKEVEEEVDPKEVEEENDRKEEREENDRKEVEEEVHRKEVEEEVDRKKVEEEVDRKEEREEMDWTEERCEEYRGSTGRKRGGCTNVEDTEQKEGKGQDVDTMKLNEDGIEMKIFLSDCVSFRRNNRSNAKEVKQREVKQRVKKNDSRPKKKVNAIEVSSSPPSTSLESQSPDKVSSIKPNPSVNHEAKGVHWADEKENAAL